MIDFKLGRLYHINPNCINYLSGKMGEFVWNISSDKMIGMYYGKSYRYHSDTYREKDGLSCRYIFFIEGEAISVNAEDVESEASPEEEFAYIMKN